MLMMMMVVILTLEPQRQIVKSASEDRNENGYSDHWDGWGYQPN